MNPEEEQKVKKDVFPKLSELPEALRQKYKNHPIYAA